MSHTKTDRMTVPGAVHHHLASPGLPSPGLPSLPMEVWVQVFTFLSGPSLFRCEAVCRAWREEISHLVHTGRLGRRGLRVSRLVTMTGAVTEHRRRVWDSLSIMADKRVVIVGVGVYTPSGETTICVDARPITDPLRPIDVSTELESDSEEDGRCLTLYGKPGSPKPFRFVLEAGEWWEFILNIQLRPGSHDPMGGGTVWAGRGKGGREQLESHGVTFSFRDTVREAWRSEVCEGQFPYFYFWPL